MPKSVHKMVRFTPKEWAVIEKKLAKSKMEQSPFLRYCVLEQVGYKQV